VIDNCDHHRRYGRAPQPTPGERGATHLCGTESGEVSASQREMVLEADRRASTSLVAACGCGGKVDTDKLPMVATTAWRFLRRPEGGSEIPCRASQLRIMHRYRLAFEERSSLISRCAHLSTPSYSCSSPFLSRSQAHACSSLRPILSCMTRKQQDQQRL
jgi:hypothetical protein